jgi:hypothetical protein
MQRTLALELRLSEEQTPAEVKKVGRRNEYKHLRLWFAYCARYEGSELRTGCPNSFSSTFEGVTAFISKRGFSFSKFCNGVVVALVSIAKVTDATQSNHMRPFAVSLDIC